MRSFDDIDLILSLRETLVQLGYTKPTEIQARTLPMLIDGKSVAGVAQTGSGKTLAYALPILNLVKTLELAKDPVTEEGTPRAVVVVPSRDLGEQVAKVFKQLTHSTRVRVRTLLGGIASEVGKRNVAGQFEVLVATPGRITQFLDRRLLSLSDVRFLVFDEADQMLDDGFLKTAKRISHECPEERQLALFSATVPPTVQELINQLFGEAKVVRAAHTDRLVATLITDNRQVVNGKRLPLLEKLVKEKLEGGTIIFANTRDQVDAVMEEMTKLGQTCLAYRGEMEKVERRKNLKAFRDGQVDYLVATDLAARGLDVAHVGRVINYHLPRELDNYRHRVGRTARAGRSGVVVNFVTERDAPLMKKIDNLDTDEE
ncbi:MAG: DEAD/DEAH box helicase [Proteobacteria bacterium]|nr:MAG: DEAD/DEAH box helicase [Pseudomonadota bacterium]